ncbi:MAG TPA: SMI1/KNR4 family protein [Ktedonobacterales bacterium]|nr:SMI1/KNR4 family protein [Ktedonobacterales bacterium]
MDTERLTPAPNQPQVTLARVKALLARLDAERTADQPQPDKQPRPAYTPEPCLKEPDLAAWEAANGVALPEAYRLFLLEIGNGGMMPGSYCDFEVWSLDDRRRKAYYTQLQEPFPLSRERFEQQIARLQTEGRSANPLFPELWEQWKGEDLPPGCLPLGHYPSYDPLFLIVNGDMRGTVWCIVADCVVEINDQYQPFDFLGWFEDTLLELVG